MEEKSVDAAAVDHITKLPEPILQKIMSFLLVKDVAQMSTLSKTLYGASSSLSYLDFGDEFLNHKYFRPIPKLDIPKFVNIVDQILVNRQEDSIQKFRLKFPRYHLSWSSYMHNWIKTLVACNIKELTLHVEYSPRDDNYFPLPEIMFAAQELYVLDLRELKLELPHDGIKFSSLRKLKLSRMFLDEHFIRALCASCICLEELTLHQCRGLTSFQITGPKLRSAWLNQFFHEIKTLDTVAPKLEDLHIAGNSRDLLEAIKISAYKALKSLHLNCVGVTDEQDIFSSLSNLETLHLFHCNALKTMKMSSDRLECLVVRWCRNLIDFELDTPNLTIFSYTTHYDLPLPTLKLKASMFLKVQLGLYLAQSTRFDSHWYFKLLEFLGNFNQ